MFSQARPNASFSTQVKPSSSAAASTLQPMNSSTLKAQGSAFPARSGTNPTSTPASSLMPAASNLDGDGAPALLSVSIHSKPEAQGHQKQLFLWSGVDVTLGQMRGRLRLEALEQERSSVMLETMREERETLLSTLTAKVEKLKRKRQEAIQREQTLRDANDRLRSQANAKQSANDATVKQLQASLHAFKTECASANIQMLTKAHEIDSLMIELDNLREQQARESQASSNEILALREKLEDATQTVKQQAVQLKQALADTEQMRHELAATNTSHATYRTAIASLTEELRVCKAIESHLQEQTHKATNQPGRPPGSAFARPVPRRPHEVEATLSTTSSAEVEQRLRQDLARLRQKLEEQAKALTTALALHAQHTTDCIEHVSEIVLLRAKLDNCLADQASTRAELAACQAQLCVSDATLAPEPEPEPEAAV
ncbi:hypothetical protein CAOG_05430 [Capsaspora owczarzaki ATCC 30864]|uniref:Uncharacterized protein n=1 Tax=Capsaspora owczarzaki (strain ATCC 30864) TaxID=595528 RepID=A0A0D2X3T3_CAPO3|nr:hypothetical protein CAOG_05430 [Capsaspora owczarzaki ATCC 30864]KJE94859.1 hypothetical protein CAOG_005430 [Capsaspora owczarzaki ATCC 30864]|eukprot:XP_004346103.1 hypothetical protein CAOG_05430 [Capsaspora owczarzaki ATCC 30864]